MASMFGYFVTVLGLSILLAFAGVDTSAHGVMNMVGMNITTSNVGNTTINHLGDANTIQNVFFGDLLGILIGIAAIGFTLLSGRFSPGESLKLGLAATLLTLLINDLISIMTYTQSLTEFGMLIQLVAYVIYLPLIGGIAIMIFNWIGGNT